MTQKNLSTLSYHDLDLALKSLISRERELLSEILLHIQEVDRRRLYLQFSHGSLFDYLTQHLGYSAGSAQRRIDAARLSVEVPSVIEDLESGAINLAQVSLLQKSIRLAKKESSSVLPLQELTKSQLLEAIKSKSISESQAIISETLNIKIKAHTATTHQSDGSVRLEVTLSKEQWEKLQRMKSLLSHSVPSGSWDELLEYVSDRVIAAKTKNREKKTAQTKKENSSITSTSFETSNQEIQASTLSFYQLKKNLLAKTNCCQYKNRLTNKICTSTWQLQVDHIKPKWAGGTDEPQNLRVLCGMHNRERYQQQAGIRRI